MKLAALTALVDQNRLMRYLTTVSATDKNRAQELLARHLYFSVLIAVLPFVAQEEHQTVARLFANENPDTQQAWLVNQSEELRQSVQETIDRVFLSLEK
jgi:protein involved in temperature-dependent protein secretion